MRIEFRGWSWTAIVLCAAALASASFLRGRLIVLRDQHGLTPRMASAAESGARSALAERQVALFSAGLGVIRPLALDFLWLRAIHLQEKGEYFEAAALSSLITGLEPRLPEVWNFQARNLAYNIPPSFPPAERYAWVLRGIQLLRDDALLYSPESPSIHLDLALLFQHKIGLDYDGAGPIYRSRLAHTFGTDRDSAEGASLWRAWKLDPDRVRRLEERHHARLDFRVAASHALYWAEKGLEAPPELTGWSRRRLEDVRAGALFQLFSAGRPVRAPDEPRYAFLPELSFERAAEAAIEDGAARFVADDLREARTSLRAVGVLARCVAVSEDEARSHFERHKLLLSSTAASFEDLILHWSTHDGERTRERALAEALDAAGILDRAREPAFAEGFRRVARLIHGRIAQTSGNAGAEPFDAELESARKRDETKSPLGELPFGLEWIAPKERRPAEP